METIQLSKEDFFAEIVPFVGYISYLKAAKGTVAVIIEHGLEPFDEEATLETMEAFMIEEVKKHSQLQNVLIVDNSSIWE